MERNDEALIMRIRYSTNRILGTLTNAIESFVSGNGTCQGLCDFKVTFDSFGCEVGQVPGGGLITSSCSCPCHICVSLGLWPRRIGKKTCPNGISCCSPPSKAEHPPHH